MYHCLNVLCVYKSIVQICKRFQRWLTAWSCMGTEVISFTTWWWLCGQQWTYSRWSGWGTRCAGRLAQCWCHHEQSQRPKSYQHVVNCGQCWRIKWSWHPVWVLAPQITSWITNWNWPSESNDGRKTREKHSWRTTLEKKKKGKNEKMRRMKIAVEAQKRFITSSVGICKRGSDESDDTCAMVMKQRPNLMLKNWFVKCEGHSTRLNEWIRTCGGPAVLRYRVKIGLESYCHEIRYMENITLPMSNISSGRIKSNFFEISNSWSFWQKCWSPEQQSTLIFSNV